MCVGAGNFTGIRTSLSAAKGIAFGINAELIGFNVFQIIASSQKKCSVIFSGSFNKFLIQSFDNGKAITDIRLISEKQLAREVCKSKVRILGFQVNKSFEKSAFYEDIQVLPIENIMSLVSRSKEFNKSRAIPFYFSEPVLPSK